VKLHKSKKIFSPAFAVLNGVFGLACLTFIFCTSTGAQKTTDLDPIHRMEQRYRAAKTLQSTFLERYTENGRTVRLESGVAYFRRPGKMRWEYEAPEKNLFLVDGKWAWFYVPADHTVTRVPARQSADWRTPLALLAGEAKVSRVCARIEPASGETPENSNGAVFKCVLRGSDEKKNLAENSAQGNAPQDGVLLEVIRDTGELVRIVVREKGGVGVEFHFAKWQSDPAIAEALFHFAVPPGVAIVNSEPADAGGAGQSQ
jgi:outer membrane lipoprotein carrier protein